MCGRYASSVRDAEVVDELDVEDVVGEALPPSWNVAPTDDVRVVVERPARAREGGGEGEAEATEAPRRQLRTARWGLVPSWSRSSSTGARMINARSETLTERSAFRVAAGRRRCLVPADGYFEWQAVPGLRRKRPWFLRGEDGGLLTFAGVYELWRDPARADDDPARWLWSVAVVTTAAHDALGQIHDRTPLVVPPTARGDWLSTGVTEAEEVRALVAALPEPRLVPHVVGPEVGDVRADGPSLVAPVPDQPVPDPPDDQPDDQQEPS